MFGEGEPPASDLLATTELSRAFGGLRAVDGVTLAIREGEVYGLIGPNGAGKTTFINLLTGFLRPDSGEVTLAGEHVAGWAAYRVAQRGLARTYQHVRLFPAMTVL